MAKENLAHTGWSNPRILVAMGKLPFPFKDAILGGRNPRHLSMRWEGPEVEEAVLAAVEKYGGNLKANQPTTTVADLRGFLREFHGAQVGEGWKGGKRHITVTLQATGSHQIPGWALTGVLPEDEAPLYAWQVELGEGPFDNPFADAPDPTLGAPNDDYIQVTTTYGMGLAPTHWGDFKPAPHYVDTCCEDSDSCTCLPDGT